LENSFRERLYDELLEIDFNLQIVVTVYWNDYFNQSSLQRFFEHLC